MRSNLPHSNQRLPMGQVESQRVGPAHIAEIYFICPTTAPTVPFVGLEPLPHHPHRHPQGPTQAAATRSTTPPPPTKVLFMPPTSTDRLARTLTTLGAHASSAAFVTFAPDAGAPPTGSGSACAPETSPLPISQHTLVTPLRPLEFERELVSHPDKGFVSDLLANIKNGCDIGYQGPHFSHTARNLSTASTHAHIVTQFLTKECRAGRVAGPYPQPPLDNLRCSGLGVVPKKDGGWRAICHLSAPTGTSINDYIDPAQYTLHYCTIDSAIAIMNNLGPNALMGKIDLKNAFRQIPVRREDWHLLGIQWQGMWYVDKCLPFGLRSSPALFNKLATAIEWILSHNYGLTNIIHYLDDFFTAGPPDTEECARHMHTMNFLCHRLGSPTKPEKEEGPSTTITFLGILLDSTTMTASITNERKTELEQAMHHIRGRRTCTKRELLSLIGKLAFACKVVPPGRIFLRRLIDLSTTASQLHHHVTLGRAARADLAWWHHFLPTWPGTSILLQSQWTLAPDMELFTDASNLGYGAYWAGRWFNCHWNPEETAFTIAWKELYAILVACSTWGHLWPRKRILFHCDNAAVVSIWGKGSCKCPNLMSLVRHLFLLAARGNYHVAITHIAGSDNSIADHLSRFSTQAFQLAASTAAPHPAKILIPVLSMDL